MCLWEWDAESVWEGAWLEWQRVAVLIVVMVEHPPPNDAHRDSSGKVKDEAKLSPCSVVLCHAIREEYLYVRAHAWFVLWYKK